MVHKKVFSAPDAAPVVLYAKNDANSEHAFPVLQGAFNPGFAIPQYDEVVADSMTKPTSVVFKNGGTTVATLTMTYSGAGVNIVRT